MMNGEVMPKVPMKAMDVRGMWHGRHLNAWNKNWQYVAEKQRVQPGQKVEHKEIHSYTWTKNPVTKPEEKVMNYVRGSASDPNIPKGKMSEAFDTLRTTVRPLKPFYGKIE